MNRKTFFMSLVLLFIFSGIYFVYNKDDMVNLVGLLGGSGGSFIVEKDVQNKAEEGGETEKQTKSTITTDSEKKIIENVPFVSQAPFGNWDDPFEQHGCEEASLIMADHWIRGKELTPEIALEEIQAVSRFEKEKYGGVYDLSISDTLKLWREYFGYKKSFVKYDISGDDIRSEIAKGNLVVVPMDGSKLENPHYTQPGPERHEMVVVGYDDGKQEFVTNDPGTRYGESYRYNYDIFMDSVRDYKTGFDEPIDKTVKAMLVIEKE